jgi:hypothetical protein
MLSKLIGLYLVLDGIGSWLLYQKQKILLAKNKIVSLHPFNNCKIKGKIVFLKQSFVEHIPRILRVSCGLVLIALPLPV